MHLTILAIFVGMLSFTLNDTPTTQPTTQPGQVYLGEVLGEAVHVDSLPDDRGERVKLLHQLFSQPLVQRYHDTNKDRIQPTEDEIRSFNQLLEDVAARTAAEWAERQATIEERLKDPDLWSDQREALEHELATLKRISEPVNLSPERKAELGRDFAVWWITRWKYNQALFRDYGGGRVLWQQFGTEAYDAQRRFYEEHERAGLFKIIDPQHRAEFYDYWMRDKGPFLSDRTDELMNPPWQKPVTTAPADPGPQS